MNKSFKRFISTMLVACMAMSMVAGAAGTETARGSTHEDVISEASYTREGKLLNEFSLISQIYYYHYATSEQVVSMSYNPASDEMNIYRNNLSTDITTVATIYVELEKQESVKDEFQSCIEQIEIGSLQMVIVPADTRDTAATYASVQTQVTRELIAKHGASVTSELSRLQDDNGNTAVLTYARSYRATNSGKTIVAIASKTPLLAVMNKFGKTADVGKKFLQICGIGVVGDMVTDTIEIGMYQGTSMEAKKVHVNGGYQYYSGKDTRYQVLTSSLGIGNLIGGLVTAHPDFDNNIAIIQKGCDNYFRA